MVSDKKLKILNDGSTSNDTRLGAVADIQFALNSGDKKDDLDVLVIAGDTLFLQDFKLEEFIRYVLICFKYLIDITSIDVTKIKLSYQLNSTVNPAHLPQNWAKLAKSAVLLNW